MIANVKERVNFIAERMNGNDRIKCNQCTEEISVGDGKPYQGTCPEMRRRVSFRGKERGSSIEETQYIFMFRGQS
jgi:hypothetical protein